MTDDLHEFLCRKAAESAHADGLLWGISLGTILTTFSIFLGMSL